MERIDSTLFSLENPVTEEHMNFIKNHFEQKVFPRFKHLKKFIEFIKFLQEINYYFHPHFLRYAYTVGYLMESLNNLSLNIEGKTIVETGTPSIILKWLSLIGCQCYYTKSDLRIEIDAPSEFADIILSLEVIEHLKDKPEKTFEEVVNFNFSGAKNYLKECRRVLKPGGILCLTTPNNCSYAVLDRIINYQAPFVYYFHVREYNVKDILEFTKDLFQCFFFTDIYAYFITLQEKYESIFDKLNLPKEGRGDALFFVFQKRM